MEPFLCADSENGTHFCQNAMVCAHLHPFIEAPMGAQVSIISIQHFNRDIQENWFLAFFWISKIAHFLMIMSIEVNNNIITDHVEICNNFNNYFVNIADQILNKRKYGGINISQNTWIILIIILSFFNQ